MFYTCSFCGLTKFSFFRYTKHLRKYHEQEPNFVVACNIQACKNTFNSVQALIRHISKRHKGSTLDSSTVNDSNSVIDMEEDIIQEQNVFFKTH